jgi:MFS superfamily sulfate permease-like transporter
MKSLFTGRYEGYSVHHLKKDLISGIIVGIVAIPLAMSFAIASGVSLNMVYIQLLLLGYLFLFWVARSIKSGDLQVRLCQFCLG